MTSNTGSMGALVLFVITMVLSSAALSPTTSAVEKKSHADSRVETLLRQWEKADREVRELHYTFQLTTEDRVLKDKETSQAEVFVKKPDLVRVDWKDKKGEIARISFWNQKSLCDYNFKEKTETIYRLSSTTPELSFIPESLLKRLASLFQQRMQLISLCFSVEEMQKRYHVELTKEDEHWAYIKFEPRTKEEEADFKVLEIVLSQKTHLVRQIRLMEMVGNWNIWDFERVEINPVPPISLESIRKGLPKDFKKVYIPPRQARSEEPKGKESILDLGKVETDPTAAISWQRLCEGLPEVWKKKWIPISQSEAIWIAKAFRSASNHFDVGVPVYTRLGENEWHVWFGDEVVIVSDDGRAYPVSHH